MMGCEITKLPPGYRFNPFEQELVTFYLKPKILGQTLACNVVEERQLYGPNSNPWQVLETYPWILSQVSVGKFEKIAYLFVNLTKKAAAVANSKNTRNCRREQFLRSAGCGTWDGQTKRTEIRDFNGDLIGERRMLVFEINQLSEEEDSFSTLGHWRMHEYSLCGVNKIISNPANTVLCKITVDFLKTPAIKLNPVRDTISQKKNNKKDYQGMDATVCSSSITNSDVVDTYAVTTPQSCCDDGLVSIDYYRPKEEEDEVDEEWLESVFVSEEGVNMNEFECPSYPKQLVDDFTSNVGKRKLLCETSYAMRQRIFLSGSFMVLFSCNLKDARNKLLLTKILQLQVWRFTLTNPETVKKCSNGQEAVTEGLLLYSFMHLLCSTR